MARLESSSASESNVERAVASKTKELFERLDGLWRRSLWLAQQDQT
jgi:hypothetical protein